MFTISLNDAQTKAAEHTGHSVVMGAAGTGKTTVLLARAAHLVAGGVAPADIAVICFSYRSAKLLETMAKKRYSEKLVGVQFGTLRDFAESALKEQIKEQTVLTNNDARDMMKRAMIEVGFKGSLSEAEHVIRSFKAQSRRPQENEPHYLLLQTYKKILDSENALDRHDLTRSHIIGLRKGTLKPAAVKHMLVDNAQDATQIQQVWLQEHMGQGVTVTATLNDDVTLFGPDGAEGANVATTLEALDGVKSFKLGTNYRTPSQIHSALNKPVRLLKQRLQKQDTPENKTPATLNVKGFDTLDAEQEFLVNAVQTALNANAGARVGIVVRHDYLANRLLHACHRAGLRPASYGRPIWEKPGAGTVLAMLYLILGQSSGARFERFLMIHLGARVGGVLAEAGLTPEQFLQSQNLPNGVELSADNVRAYHSLRRRVNGYMRLVHAGSADARDVFKATVADTLPKLSAEEQEDALLAASILLSLKGRLAELLPRLEQETLPDMQSSIVITPVRETRNMEFDTLFMPYMQEGNWPAAAQILGVDHDHERRMLHQALTRTKGSVTLTHNSENNAKPSSFLRELT